MSQRSENIDRHREEYSRAPSDAARQVEKMVLGREVGLAGYTTVRQAESLVTHLAVSRGELVLDLGAGRGWPGSLVAASTACRLIATDVPAEALVAARSYLKLGRGPGRAHRVCADGGALPFPDRTFNGVVHADVFC